MGRRPTPRQGLRPWTPLGALPPNSRPLLKKRGKTSWKASLDFLQDALARRFLEAARLVWGQEMGREITDRSKGRQDPSDPGGAAAFGRPGRPSAARACQTKERGAGAFGPCLALFQGASRPAAAPPWAAGVSTATKKRSKKPGPALYGAWRLKIKARKGLCTAPAT